MKKKVAFVNGGLSIPAVRGGAIQTLITALLNENEKNKVFDFTVITPYDKLLESVSEKYQYTKIIPIKVNPIERILSICYQIVRKLSRNKLPYLTVFFYKANKILKQEEYDIVFFETSDEGFVQAYHYHNEKIAFHIHADYLNEHSCFIEKIKENADFFICVSDFIRGQILSCGVPDRHAITFHNAIDVDRNQIILQGKAQYRKEIRQKYNLSDSDFLVLYCSRLSPEKGVLELIKAVNLLDNVNLIVVGGENFSSDKKTDYVLELEKEANRNSRRIIFTGYVNHDEVTKYMCAADIAVVPSICNEAASLTLIEFRSMGLPTIASRRGGIPEYSNRSATHFVDTDHCFIQNIAAAILDLKNNAAKRKEFSNYAVKDITDFGYESYYKRFIQLTNELIK